jgi:hypothetical protein
MDSPRGMLFIGNYAVLSGIVWLTTESCTGLPGNAHVGQDWFESALASVAEQTVVKGE